MDKIRAKIVLQTLQLFKNRRSLTKENIKEVITILFPEENKVNIINLVEKSIEMYCSLNQAMDEAGGALWDTSLMNEMTVIDLITTLSVNNIRFIYIKESIQDQYRYANYRQKLMKLEAFANEMIDEFKEALQSDPQNIIAASAIDIYFEIKKKINE